MLSRHGVRGPYGLGTEAPSRELLNKYVRNPNVNLPLSANAWGTSETDDPTEIVSPKLTKHGFRVVKHMGEVCVVVGRDVARRTDCSIHRRVVEVYASVC